ncbi:glycosyltransferase family 4 protein [Akkermansiaceae bacterium]|nr:glycosyltransferase family 4 protein [Akkermansiaceae bacterium]
MHSSTMELFLLPSYYEGLPNALLEAMTHGFVPVVTPVGLILNIIIDKINGLLVKANDSMSLAHAINRLKPDLGKAKELGNQARLTVKNKYSLEEYLKSINAIYGELVPSQ